MKGHRIQTSKTEESPCAGVPAGPQYKEISTKKPLKIYGKSLNREFNQADLESPLDITKRLSCSSVVFEILDSDQGIQTTENTALELNQTLSGLTETRTTLNFSSASKIGTVSGEFGTVLSVLNFANADCKSTKLVVDALVTEVVARLCRLPEEEKGLVVSAKGPFSSLLLLALELCTGCCLLVNNGIWSTQILPWTPTNMKVLC